MDYQKIDPTSIETEAHRDLLAGLDDRRFWRAVERRKLATLVEVAEIGRAEAKTEDEVAAKTAAIIELRALIDGLDGLDVDDRDREAKVVEVAAVEARPDEIAANRARWQRLDSELLPAWEAEHVRHVALAKVARSIGDEASAVVHEASALTVEVAVLDARRWIADTFGAGGRPVEAEPELPGVEEPVSDRSRVR